MIKSLLSAAVDFCSAHARAVAVAGLLAFVALSWITAARLGMDTNTDNLFSDELAWRQGEWDFKEAFPQTRDRLVVVIDAPSPTRAEDAANALAEKLNANPALFPTVQQPEGGDFFQRHGLLYFSVEDLAELSARIAEMQPLLGTLTSDPTLAGLFDMLANALDAVAAGQFAPELIAAPLAAMADTADSVLAGDPRVLSWRQLVAGKDPAPEELRRFILVQPKLHYGALQPGAEASSFIRSQAVALGLTPSGGVRVRLTGSVALSDEELATVAEGTGIAAIASIALVTLLLVLGVRSLKLVACILGTLITGIVATSAFAAVSVGSLNIISIGFVVLFIGIAVDFGIQFCVRFNEQLWREPGVPEALHATAHIVGPALALAAAACAAGFLALVPTDYKGMTQMGLISGAGMVIALFLNLTLLPALLRIARPVRGHAGAGISGIAPILDRFLLAKRRPVLVLAVIAGAAGLIALPALEFDFDPLHVRNPKSESVSTLYDLMGSDSTTPFTINVLRPPGEAAAMRAKLLQLPEVDRVLSLDSFVPDNQEEKLAMIDELSLLTGGMQAPPGMEGGASGDRTEKATANILERLHSVESGSPLGAAAKRLANAISALAGRNRIAELEQPLLSELPAELRNLELALQAAPVTAESLPAVVRDNWVAVDGRLRLEVFSKGDIRDNRVRERFADAVQAVAPDAVGSVISGIESGRTIVDAFVTAGWVALATIAVLLAVVLRRVRDVCLVLTPLLLGGLITTLICVLADFKLNFANIIALPLIMGVGVSFAIYFVINWRNGLASPLQSPTARAVLFSALTTGVAFGSLMLSTHPGTASMGTLLSLSLACTLFCTLIVLPALLGPPPKT